MSAPQPGSGASSSAVSAGKTVGFFEWLRNDGPSNISQLFVNGTTSPSANVTGGQWTIKTSSGAVVRSGLCATTTPLVCSFGALNATQTVYLVVAFAIAGNVADGTTENVTFNWDTTGVPPGKNQSHGDALPLLDSLTITSNGDNAGDFNLSDPTGITVADNQKLNGQNRQATSATLGQFLVGLAVGDGPGEPPAVCNTGLIAGIVADNPWFSCSLLTSLTSRIEAGNGKTFVNTNGGPGIKVAILFSQAPNQLNGAHPFTYHYFVDAAGTGHAELITAPCTFVGGFPAGTTPSQGCFNINGKTITVWVFHNGGYRN